MNRPLSTRRLLLALLAVAALVVAACGNDDDDEAGVDPDPTETTAPPVDEPDDQRDTTDPGYDLEMDVPEVGAEVPMSPAELSVEDQTGDGATVEVAAVTLPAAGFIAVHSDADGPGPVIGVSELLPEGESIGVVITLDEPVDSDTTLWPMAHIDTNQNGVYDFDPPDSTEDGPATFADGDVAVLPLTYTLE